MIKSQIWSSLVQYVSHLRLCPFSKEDSLQDVPILTAIPRAPAGPEGPIGPCAPCEGRARTSSGNEVSGHEAPPPYLPESPEAPDPGATSRCSKQEKANTESPPPLGHPLHPRTQDTHSLSSVSLFASWASRARRAWGPRSSRGTQCSSLTTITLQEQGIRFSKEHFRRGRQRVFVSQSGVLGPAQSP